MFYKLGSVIGISTWWIVQVLRNSCKSSCPLLIGTEAHITNFTGDSVIKSFEEEIWASITCYHPRGTFYSAWRFRISNRQTGVLVTRLRHQIIFSEHHAQIRSKFLITCSSNIFPPTAHVLAYWSMFTSLLLSQNVNYVISIGIDLSCDLNECNMERECSHTTGSMESNAGQTFLFELVSN